MTENEAIQIAEQYAKTLGLRNARLGSTRHITVDLLDNLHQEAVRTSGVCADEEETYRRMRVQIQKRSHWAVNFISDCPSDTVRCPAGPMILVYDDTGEAEVFPVL
jgi:hypothetical protein